MAKQTDPYLLHSVFPGIFPDPKPPETRPMTTTPTTYVEHLAEAERAASHIESEHANPQVQAAVAQAHALTAIAMLLEELLATISELKEPEPYHTVRIIGGLGHPSAH